MNTRLERYTISATDFDCGELLAEWRWLLKEPYTPFMLTRFGDWFLRTEKNRVHFLDLLEGSIFDLGDIGDLGLDSDDFVVNYKDQLSVDWVEICLERGLFLRAEQCYGWKIHPALSGAFEFSNIQIFSLRVYESLTGQLLRQLRSHPKGFIPTGFAVRNDSEESAGGADP